MYSKEALGVRFKAGFQTSHGVKMLEMGFKRTKKQKQKKIKK